MEKFRRWYYIQLKQVDFHDVKIVNYWQSFYDEVLLSFLYKRKIAKDEDH